MRILSADDKAENLYMLEALLRGNGHQVDSASDGMEALRLAQAGPYDLIISDILMPRMDGFQLCRELKKDERLRHIPLVFYTATYTDSKDAAFAMGLGAERFLIKPMEPDQFVKVIEEVMAGRITGSASQPTEQVPDDESIYLKEYNARLIAKLEEKMLDLESANQALREDIAERERHAAERTRLERQLRQAQKLEAIGTLAGGIAHDFNNLLGVIIGFAELGEMECEERSSIQKLFAEIVRAATRGRGLTQQVMAFSRQADSTREAVMLDRAVLEVIDMTRGTVPPTIEVVTEFGGPIAPVLANSTQIHQIVANLLHNACHAIGGHEGRVTIKLDDFHVDDEFVQLNPSLQTGRYVRLTVSDTGHGMDDKTVERIFDPFFTTKAFGEGTGLGLSVVHGIMKAYDGAITVYSEPGHGSNFYLYFPAHVAELTYSPEPARTVSFGHGERILVLDDDTAIARLTARSLERLGYVATSFTEAQAALNAFRARSYDLVITDLTMADATGLEIARDIWQERPDTPVLLVTGYSATLDRTKARVMGFRDLLYKPYTAQELGACVRNILTQMEVA